MTLPAYDNDVFKPLEDAQLAEGMRVEVHLPTEGTPKKPKSAPNLQAFGMWADREDIPDGISYEDRMDRPRY